MHIYKDYYQLFSLLLFRASGGGDYLLSWIHIIIDNSQNVVRSQYCMYGGQNWEYTSLSLYIIPIDLEIFIEIQLICLLQSTCK